MDKDKTEKEEIDSLVQEEITKKDNKKKPPNVKGGALTKGIEDNKKTVILQVHSGMFEDDEIEELEKKYEKKFGRKVIVLESSLKLVDIIHD